MKPKQPPAPTFQLLLHPERDGTYVHFEDALHHPFDHAAIGFSRVNAWWLADAALLAYWDEAPARAIWRGAGLELTFLSVDGVQCHVASNDAVVIVAFRGTEPRWDDLSDIVRVRPIRYGLGGRVHDGFFGAYETIRRPLQKALGDLDAGHRSIWLTGHSLGGALATLAMDDVPAARGLYTMGAPPVGSRRFAIGFNRRHRGRCFRYVNDRDIVAGLPRLLLLLLGRYTHVRERKFIDRQGRISGRSRPVDEWFAALKRHRVRMAPVIDDDAAGLVPPPEPLADHIARSYAVHIWNDYATARSPVPSAGV